MNKRKTKIVKVFQSSNILAWYSHRIGEQFEIYEEIQLFPYQTFDRYYIKKSMKGKPIPVIAFILKQDCILVK